MFKRQMKDHQSQSSDVPSSSSKSKSIQGLTCSLCQNMSVDRIMHDIYNENVCANCKFTHDEYKTISRKDAIERFLVPDGRFSSLRFQSKPNPQNPSWTAMKLYLVKHVREVALDRYGSEEALEGEKRLRQKRKFEKDSNEVLETFTFKSLHSAGGATGGCGSADESAEGKALAERAPGGSNILSVALQEGLMEGDSNQSLVHREGASVINGESSSNKKQKKVSAAVLKHAQRKKALSAMISSVKASHRSAPPPADK